MKDIDELNILQAALKAMEGAVFALPSQTPDFVFIDGTQIPKGFQQHMCQTVVKGDTKSTVIAAASILAKVHRFCCMSLRQQVMNARHTKERQDASPACKGDGEHVCML